MQSRRIERGAVVTEIDPDGPAADEPISIGEVILEVSQEPVSNAVDARDQISRLKSRGRNSALLLVANASGEWLFVVIPIPDDEE